MKGVERWRGGISHLALVTWENGVVSMYDKLYWLKIEQIEWFYVDIMIYITLTLIDSKGEMKKLSCM